MGEWEAKAEGKANIRNGTKLEKERGAGAERGASRGGGVGARRAGAGESGHGAAGRGTGTGGAPGGR